MYKLIIVFYLTFLWNELDAQVANLPYSFEIDQKMGTLLYSPTIKLHTSSKSPLLKGDLLTRVDSMKSNEAVNPKNWFLRKLFNEHLIQIEKEDHTFYADFLPDMYIGKDMMGDKSNVWMNSRGIQAGLNIGDKFSFYTSFHESQAVFPVYLDNYINERRVVPGQGGTKFQADNKKDWMYSTANLTYDFSRYFQLTLAYDKNFIGDGYRSMLLSDFSSNFTHLKLRGEIGNVQYTSITAYINDPTNLKLAVDGSDQRLGDGVKWGSFQYLDWNVTRRLSIGFFQSLVWSQRDNRRERPEELLQTNRRGKGDNMFLGFTSKYKIDRTWSGYGQFIFGGLNVKEVFSGNGYAGNKWAGQLGLRGHDIADIRNLNLLVEFNTARPYMYAHRRPVSNYSNNSEPLAHPQGANFREILAIGNYSWDRFYFQLQANYIRKGVDVGVQNYGGNIFKSYKTVSDLYGNGITQGIKKDTYYVEGKVAYVLNPKYNLRLETGYSQRYSKIDDNYTQADKSGVFLFGLRSSFRNIYQDF